jgi:uncharacterized protein
MEPLSTDTPLFPLGQGLFPDSLLSLNIFEVRYLSLIKRCQQSQSPFGVVFLAQGSEVQKAGELETLFPWGAMAHLVSVTEIQPALLQVKCRGGARFHLADHARGAFGLWHGRLDLKPADPVVPIPPHLQHLANRLGEMIATAQKKGLADHLPLQPPYRLDECGWVANRWADLLPLPTEEKVALLAKDDPEERLNDLKDFF